MLLLLHRTTAAVLLTGAQNKIKNLADKAKAYVNNVSELELKVLEATNHDPWGPHGSVMQGGCADEGTHTHQQSDCLCLRRVEAQPTSPAA